MQRGINKVKKRKMLRMRWGKLALISQIFLSVLILALFLSVSFKFKLIQTMYYIKLNKH